ncbi:MAG TPA: transporter substrate-binding domain-containing protein [Vicinamibacterales bacterium]|jgi:membrane-bound lytic murein transglycosylase MltF
MTRKITVLALLVAVSACSKSTPQQTATTSAPAPAAVPAPSPSPASAPDAAAPSAAATETSKTAPAEDSAPEYEAVLPESVRAVTDKPFTGDFDAMLKRRLIRIGVTFNRTFYFIDNGAQRGLAYEYANLYEDQLNKRLKTGNLKVHVVMLPMPRDILLKALRDGKVDMVVAQLTVTPSRQQLVDFSAPTRRDVSEIVVTGPDAPPIASVDDLSGKDVFVRKSSSYYETLVALNKRFAAEGKKPVDIKVASESLDDDDLLEMVNAGLLPAIVVDNYLARFWKQVFTDITVHDDVALHTGGMLAVAIRKNSPQLAADLNGFIAKQGLDSAIGAILNKRYLQSTKYVKGATSEAERKKFLSLIEIFRRYGDKYKFDFLMMAAQGYQESRLDQNAKSPVGAIGVMQLMPETGKEQKVGDVHQIDPNIHAGVKYMRSIRSTFFEKEPMDDLNKGLFTFAAYNAGPGRVRQLRVEAKKRGLNPNIWFGNVERIASERIGRETVTYVSNIYKYYVAYKLVATEQQRKKHAVSSTGGPH